MTKKYVYSAKFMSVPEAAVEFPGPDDHLTALQEGTLVAQGRYIPDATDDDPMMPEVGEHKAIPATAWLDCQLNETKTSLFHEDLHYAYQDIRIERRALEALAKSWTKAAVGRGGGRTLKYDWDKFWVEVATDLHYGYRPSNAAKWAEKYDGASEIWGLGQNASQVDVRKKLKKLLSRLEERDLAEMAQPAINPNSPHG